MVFVLTAGVALVVIGFIVGVLNMISGITRMDGNLGGTFTRHGIVMIMMFIGMVLVLIGGGSMIWNFISPRL